MYDYGDRIGYAVAIPIALKLHERGNHWSYRVIADVMGEYHGFYRCSEWWRTELTARGATLRPRGRPFSSNHQPVAASWS